MKLGIACVAAVAAICMVASGISTGGRDESGLCGRNVKYTYMSNGTLIIELVEDFQGDGRMFDYEYGTNPAPWANDNIKILEVKIREGVTYIGNDAFNPCSIIEEVHISSSVQSIHSSAFSTCALLLFFDVSESNQYFKSIDGVLFDHNVTTLIKYPGSIFSDTYRIPDTVVAIGDYAFYRVEELNNLFLPDSLESIGKYAFSGSGLTEMSMPYRVHTIEEYTFESCFNLRSVKIGKGVTDIGKNAFAMCGELDSISIPAVKTIGQYAFSNCGKLDYVTFSNQLISIGDGAFSFCKSLKDLSIPDSVEYIGSYSFQNTNLTSVVIPTRVKSIGTATFSKCEYLETVAIPDSVNDIGDYSFESCSRLRQIIIPSSVKTIGFSAFRSCNSMQNVIIPEGVESIGEYAFDGCPLSTLVIPGSIKSIGHGAFQSSFMKYLYYQGTSTELSSADVFTNPNALPVVCVPPDYTSTYFLKAYVTRSVSECQSFEKLFNHCYQGTFIDGYMRQQLRKNATDYEDLTNGCMEYHCSNQSGRVSWSLCNSTENVSNICIRGQCVSDAMPRTPNGKKWSVVLLLVSDEVKPDDVNITDIALITSNMSGVDVNDIVIGVEVDDEGYVISVVVYVDDEEMANSIAYAVQEMDKGEQCQHGVLCKTKSVTIEVAELTDLSTSVRIRPALMMAAFVMIAFIMMYFV